MDPAQTYQLPTSSKSQMSPHQPSRLLTLPTELLLQILDFCTILSRNNLRLTCKFFSSFFTNLQSIRITCNPCFHLEPLRLVQLSNLHRAWAQPAHYTHVSLYIDPLWNTCRWSARHGDDNSERCGINEYPDRWGRTYCEFGRLEMQYDVEVSNAPAAIPKGESGIRGVEERNSERTKKCVRTHVASATTSIGGGGADTSSASEASSNTTRILKRYNLKKVEAVKVRTSILDTDQECWRRGRFKKNEDFSNVTLEIKLEFRLIPKEGYGWENGCKEWEMMLRSARS